MATLDLTQAKRPVVMDDPKLVGFAEVLGVPSSTAWSYLTTGGHRVLVRGTNMGFDGGGRPNAGTATAIEIDVGNDGVTDLVITGMSVAANDVTLAALHGGPAGFWRLLLDGNDVIHGPQLVDGRPFGTFVTVGDGVAARPGDTSGGRDVILTGDAEAAADGDVENVGSPVVGSPVSTYRGGDDEILGLVTDRVQGMSGDASRVYRGSLLDGGNDSIFIQSLSTVASAVGDAYDVVGRAVGGDDYIAGGKDFQGKLVGDVMEAHPGSVVQGGNDRINGGDFGETIVGDVYKLRGGQLVGGDDTINGGGGNDVIAGDAYVVSDNPGFTGGDDVIDAGGGNDEVYGDAGYDALGQIGAGGNDRVYGGSGNDRLHGERGDDVLDGGTQSDTLYGGDGNDWLSGGADNDTLHGDAGNDQLDGGGGADFMGGLTGNDTYFVNDAGDVVYELAGFGIDTVWTTLGTTTAWANVEVVRYNGVGNFTGIGNGLDNAIEGGALEDRLEGGDGSDVLTGGAGADLLVGGNGVDTASYASAFAGVDARLTGNSLTLGGDARGDSYSGVENLTGSGFQDNLSGDDQANTLAGLAAFDNLYGLGGNDVLIGGEGTDSLIGGDGNDVLRGGRQADVLIGGLGGDVFDFDAVADSAPAARDVIRGAGGPAFEGVGVAGGDRIDLSGIDARAGVAGNQGFVLGGTGAGRVSLVNSGTDTIVRCNIDADAAFELQIVVEDGSVVASAYRAVDFML
jgi:Ca2+-binding RTX toxin-like protein